MGALIKFYMRVINSHKINEEWLRAIMQIVGEGGFLEQLVPSQQQGDCFHLNVKCKNNFT